MGVLDRLLLAWCSWRPPVPYFQPGSESLTEVRRKAARPFIDDLKSLCDMGQARVLDLGCGEGGLAVALARSETRCVFASDLSSVSIHRGAAVARLHDDAVGWLVQDASALGLRSESLDVILSIATFEHFPDPAAVLAECHRVLKSGGVLYASFEPYYGPGGGHVFDFISIPWIHLVTSERTLLTAWSRLARSNPALAGYNFTIVSSEVGLRRAFLNRISVRRFEALAAASGFEIERLSFRFVKDLHRVRAFRPVGFLLRELVTTNITAVLRKAGSHHLS